MSNYVNYTDYDSKKNQSNYVNYTEKLSHVRGRVSLPTGLSDEEVLHLYHKLGELSIEAAKNNLAYEILFEELGLDKDDYPSAFVPVEQIVL